MRELLAMARGEEPCELLFTNGQVVDVFSGRLLEEKVAVSRGTIIGLGDYEAQKEIDLQGRILSPGFTDSHVHLESSMVSVAEYARRVIPLGTTTVVVNPSDIASVVGKDGLQYILEEGRRYPWNFHLMLPSIFPSHCEALGQGLTTKELLSFLEEGNVLGLGEVLRCTDLIQGHEDLVDILQVFRDKPVEGCAPGLREKELNACVLAGMHSDHDVLSVAEAREKIRSGLYVMLRESSGPGDILKILPAVHGPNIHRFLLATDHGDPLNLRQGHINHLLHLMTREGFSPLQAVALATLNPAQAYGWFRQGAIAPGYRADLVVLRDMERWQVDMVFKDGVLVGRGGESTFSVPGPESIPHALLHTINTHGLKREALQLPQGRVYRVIQVRSGEKRTGWTVRSLEVRDGQVENLIENGLAKVAVMERYQNTGQVGLGLVEGLSLQSGAVATSVAHDSHHLLILGVNDEDMLKAVQEIERRKGGLVVVEKGKVLASLSLPLAGLMATEPLDQVAQKLEELEEAAHSLGTGEENFFKTLSFLTSPMLSSLQLTPQGLFDVEASEPIPLVVE